MLFKQYKGFLTTEGSLSMVGISSVKKWFHSYESGLTLHLLLKKFRYFGVESPILVILRR